MQVETVGPLDEFVGYMLKRAATTLRYALDATLRPMDLSVPQYACLELLGRQSGLSNADLARGAFVTRQSMNGVLRGLEERGLVTRPVTAPSGRALPGQLHSGWSSPAPGREREGPLSREADARHPFPGSAEPAVPRPHGLYLRALPRRRRRSYRSVITLRALPTTRLLAEASRGHISL